MKFVVCVCRVYHDTTGLGSWDVTRAICEVDEVYGIHWVIHFVLCFNCMFSLHLNMQGQWKFTDDWCTSIFLDAGPEVDVPDVDPCECMGHLVRQGSVYLCTRTLSDFAQSTLIESSDY